MTVSQEVTVGDKTYSAVEFVGQVIDSTKLTDDGTFTSSFMLAGQKDPIFTCTKNENGTLVYDFQTLDLIVMVGYSKRPEFCIYFQPRKKTAFSFKGDDLATVLATASNELSDHWQ